MTGEPVVQVGGLVKHYGPVRAVDGIDLTVIRGEIYVLLGLNGAGKTTTIRMLLGMIRPTSGSVRLYGRPLRQRDRAMWADVGYLVETPAAYPELTVSENLRLVARLRNVPERSAVGAVVRDLGLGPVAQRRTRDLSLGNQQRLGLAKALIHRPSLLVLDEPANGLDPAGVVEIRHLLQELAAGGVTVLLSSHILTEVARLATRIGIIHKGRLITEMSTVDLSGLVRRHVAVAARDLAAAGDVLRRAGYLPVRRDEILLLDGVAVERPDDVATVLVGAGQPPTHLAVEEEDLETLFLRLTGTEVAL